MPKFEYRFDIAAILLASVLTVLGLSAEAGSKPGGSTDGRSDAAAATSATKGGSDSAGTGGSGFTQTGGKAGGVVGSRK